MYQEWEEILFYNEIFSY